MRIQSSPIIRSYSRQEQPIPPSTEDSLGYLKLGLVVGACAGVGYAGSLAHGIPYVGPVISGAVGAVSGALAGASAGAQSPHFSIKQGLVAGAVGGALLGAAAGGHMATNLLMAAGAATAPYGALAAFFALAFNIPE